MGRVNKKLVRRLAANGVDSDSKPAAIKSTFKKEFPDEEALSKKEIKEVQKALAPAKPKGKATKPKTKKKVKAKKKVEPTRTPEELMSSAKAFVKAKKKEIGSFWNNVKGIVETTPKGQPARVVITCSDPQTVADGSKICDKTREIAIQDLFQVTRCVSCQKRSVQIYRNELARRRRAELASRRAKS